MKEVTINTRLGSSSTRVAIMAVVTAALMSAVFPAHRTRADGGVNYRPPQPSAQEIIDAYPDDVVHVPGPPPATIDPDLKADDLASWGVYRIVPLEFAGELPYDVLPSDGVGAVTNDPEAVKSSTLYVEPSIPPSFKLVLSDTYDGGLRSAVRLLFADAGGRQIEVIRVKISRSVIDILDGGSGPAWAYDNELGTVLGHEAVFFQRSQYALPCDNIGHIRFFQDGVETGILGKSVDVKTLLGVAESVSMQGSPASSLEAQPSTSRLPQQKAARPGKCAGDKRKGQKAALDEPGAGTGLRAQAQPEAPAVVKTVKMQIGTRTSVASITQWWHSPLSSLDIVPNYGGDGTVDASIDWRSVHIAGPTGLRVTVIPDVGSCKQTRVTVHPTGGSLDLGDYWYLHLNNTLATGVQWNTDETINEFTTYFVGTIASSDNAGCPWFGAHLHQGGDSSAATKLYQNWDLQDYATDGHDVCTRNGTDPCVIYPTGGYTNRWMHYYTW